MQGLAILTVIKAGFLGSARFGSGLVVARLADGTWSAPSALATGGGGFGGQIGFELTDFVFILNDAAAVKTFSQQGSITLGGNVSIAAGPVGRNAEAAGAASLKSVAGVFSYSKTKGLFAGVSIEGSVLIERRDANEKLYNSRITARQLLEGGVRPPPESEPLMRVLNSRVFAGKLNQESDYNDIPTYPDGMDSFSRDSRSNSNNFGEGNEYEYRDNPAPQRSATWASGGDPTSPRSPNSRANPYETFDNLGSPGRRPTFGSDNKPARPTAPKPPFQSRASASSGGLGPNQVRAVFTFDSTEPGDLVFKKGDIITVTQRTENATDWWTGEIDVGYGKKKTGIFPR